MMPRVEFVEELRIGGELSVEVEGVHVEQLLEVHLRLVGAEDLRVRIELARLLFDAVEVRLIDEIGFVEQKEIGHGDLLAGGLGLLHLFLDLLGIDDGDDRVEPDELLKLREY